MPTRPKRQSLHAWRIWLITSYAVIVIVLAALWGYSLFAPIDQAEQDQQFDSLTAIANAGSVMLEHVDMDAQDIVKNLAADSNIRATLIDATGTVLADSRDDASTMANHAERPEFITALAGGIGKAQRVSATDGIEYLYVAVLSTYHGDKVVLRISRPVSQINAMAQGFRTFGLGLLILAILLAIVVAWIAFSRTTKPVNELERVRTDFVANASHELKTPVAGIKLLSEAIGQANRDGDTEQVAVFVKRLDKESGRLQKLVYDLLDLSRLESSKIGATTDFYSIVTTAVEGHRGKAERRGLTYVFDDRIEGDEDCHVNLSGSDATLLVDNLIDNALSYTEEGSVAITLSTHGSSIVLVVADTGIGIPAAHQERIFERFYRVDTARSREAGGTGLGLSLVRHIVERGRGSIDLDSTPGKGSTFTVTLPRA